MSPKVKIYLHFYITLFGFILSLLIGTTDYYLNNKQNQPFSMYTFADFEQVIIKFSHFDTLNKSIKISHFANFEQVKLYYQQSFLERNQIPRPFFRLFF